MNPIVLHGSPRKNQNSDTLVDILLKGLGQEIQEKTKHFYTNEMEIRPCQGCLSCADENEKSCIIKDDMTDIYSAFIDADLIVFATPMYWGYITAQLKTVIDRMEALVMWDHFRGKTFVVLITYHHHCQSTVAFFERICKFFEVRLYIITCRTLDEQTGKDLPVSNFPVELDQAYALGRNLAG